jgi:hypothetical protein
MNVLDILLGPAPQAVPDAPPQNPLVRTVLVEQDVVVHVHEDPRGERLALSSTPGRASWDDWPHESDQPCWDSRRHPDHEQAVSALRLDPGTRELHLIDIWPRAALDAVTLRQQLSAHAQRHRDWRERLRRNSSATPSRKASPYTNTPHETPRH